MWGNGFVSLIGQRGLEGGMRETALGRASKHGHHEVVAALLSAGANPNLLEFGSGREWSPLLSAVINGEQRCAELLIAAGADVDYYDPALKYSIISKAAGSGNLDILLMVLSSGADILRTPDIPFAYTAQGAPLRVVALLEDLRSGSNLDYVLHEIESVSRQMPKHRTR
jgi:ankyrin repeat protein